MIQKFRKAVQECEESKQSYFQEKTLVVCREGEEGCHLICRAKEAWGGGSTQGSALGKAGREVRKKKRNKQNNGKWKTELILLIFLLLSCNIASGIWICFQWGVLLRSSCGIIL